MRNLADARIKALEDPSGGAKGGRLEVQVVTHKDNDMGLGLGVAYKDRR